MSFRFIFFLIIYLLIASFFDSSLPGVLLLLAFAYFIVNKIKMHNKEKRNKIINKNDATNDSLKVEISNQKEVLSFLDLETTGFEPPNAEIIEIYILKVVNNEIIDEFYTLVKPKKSITNSHIHGINDIKVRNSPEIKEVVEKILEFVKDTTLIGHNIDGFDLKFLNYYLNTNLENKTIDTLKMSREILGSQVENHKLNTLAKYFNVKLPTHSAKDDVMATFEIYKKLISIQ